MDFKIAIIISDEKLAAKLNHIAIKITIFLCESEMLQNTDPKLYSILIINKIKPQGLECKIVSLYNVAGYHTYINKSKKNCIIIFNINSEKSFLKDSSCLFEVEIHFICIKMIRECSINPYQNGRYIQTRKW